MEPLSGGLIPSGSIIPKKTTASNPFSAIPNKLTARPQWVVHKAKHPFNPLTGYGAKAGDPSTWVTFQAAVDAYNTGKYDGIGFEFNNNGLVGIDLDTVRDPTTGEVAGEAVKIIEALASYTEISPSGYGFHIICDADIALEWNKTRLPDNDIIRPDIDPQNGQQRLDKEGNPLYKKPEIEMYTEGRYFTVTGQVWGYTTIEPRTKEVRELHKQFSPQKNNPTVRVLDQGASVQGGKDYLTIGLEKDTTFRQLWDGERPNGNESADDMALMNKLAYWCNCDIETMIAAFEQSSHHVQKDPKHAKKAARGDYLLRTAQKAAQECQRTAAENDQGWSSKQAIQDFTGLPEVVPVPPTVDDGVSDAIDGTAARELVDKQLETDPVNLSELLPDELLDQLLTMSDEVACTRELSRLREVARKHGFARDFNKLVEIKKSWLKAATKPARPQGPVKIRLPNPPLSGLLCPEGWSVKPDGIRCYTDLIPETVCPHPVLITGRLRNVETDLEKIVLSFYRDHQWRSFPVKRSIAASRQGIVSLADSGIQVTSETARGLVSFLHNLESCNDQTIPLQQSISRVGWIGDKDFFPYTATYQFDGDEEYRTTFEAMCAQGDPALWVKQMDKARRQNPLVRAMLAASFSSPLISKLGKLCYCLHLWGKSGTAKTVALYTAMSIWGNPTHLSKTFNATETGLELSAAFCHSIPLALDERETARNDRYNAFDQMIYRLCEGQGRARGTRSGGMQSTNRWCLSILSNGEAPLLSNNSKGGAMNRVLELNCSSSLFDDPPAMADFVKENYGTAGQLFVEHIIEEQQRDGLKQIKARYDKIYRFLLDDQHTEKQAGALAMLTLGDELSSQWIFGMDEQTAHIEALALAGVLIDELPQKSDMDSVTNAWDHLNGWLAQNKEHFIQVNSTAAVERYGMFKEGKGTFIMAHIFDQALTDAGYNPKACAREFARKDWIIKGGTDDDIRIQSQARVGGIRVRGYWLQVDTNWSTL